MKKFCVISGFLGSGKTTVMMALTRYWNSSGIPAAMISNDLGSKGLADHRYASLAGCNASELTGNCICYQTENLAARLEERFAEGCQMVLSDIPGFGVGALEHVYHTLHRQYPNCCTLSPFTVLVEPHSLKLLAQENDPRSYILHAQLVEADLIVLNKRDLLSSSQLENARSLLASKYPLARILTVSSLTGSGVPELAQALLEGSASLRRPDIGYGGPSFQKAMGCISEYNSQYYVQVCCNTFDGNQYLLDLGNAVSRGIQQVKAQIPHLKLLAWEPEGDYAKLDLLGTDREIRVTKRFSHPCTDLAVVLNTSALCPSDTLDNIVSVAAEQISRKYGLTKLDFMKECFGMGK